LAKAKQCFETALQLAPAQSMPTKTMAMIGLGLIAEENDDPAEAVRQYSSAMTVQPTEVGFLLLAHALQQDGRSDEANAILDRLRLSPNLAEAQSEAESLRAGR